MKLAPSCLQLDVGNSSAKWRLVVDGIVQARGAYVMDDANSQQELLDCTPELEQVWVSSVASPATESRLAFMLEQRWNVKPWFARTTAEACGLKNSYAEPGRMGVDRWLAMIAAWDRVRGPLCVIDAGSALTIDFLDEQGGHRGGYILPGLAMMERALLKDTDRVRFGEAGRDRLEPGDSTEAAVLNGLRLSQVGAMEFAITRFGEDGGLLFTGGDGADAMRLLDRGGHYCADLVLDGLGLLGATARVASGEPA